jgi:enoyl-CoA hydratase/carnithine racemase
VNNLVEYRCDGPIATISLNRPDKLNAMNSAVVDELARAFGEAAADDDVKVTLLCGNGRAFSAGFDITDEIDDGPDSPLQWQRVLRRDVDVTMSIWAHPKPTIAAVHGYCLAGGCEMAMACDMIVAAENAQFGVPDIQYGSGPVTLLMPFILGQKKVNELLFTGDRIDALHAERIGLVNTVVPADELMTEAWKLALRIAPTPLPILNLTKLAINRAYEAMGLRTAVNHNVDISALLNGANTPEQGEFDRIASADGLRAALAWRDARYSPPEA